MGKLKFLLFLVPATVLLGCAAGYCRSAKTPVQNVFVYKPDGSLQCGQGKAIDVEVMARELESVKIISSKKANDGLLRPTVCGAPTGQINVYEIPYHQLPKALKAGFKELKK